MVEPWFIEENDGTISGPFHERQVAVDLLSGKIDATQRVRQGDSGKWYPAERARNVFLELAEQGWYVRSNGQTFGPFTPNRILELSRSNELATDADLRQGLSGPWRPANSILALWQAPPHTANDPPDTTSDTRAKWITEPIRHYTLPLELAQETVVASCHPLEHLQLQQSQRGAKEILAIVRSNDQIVGYLSELNSQQLLTNSRRGITHVILLATTDTATDVVVILCPPRDDARCLPSLHRAKPREVKPGRRSLSNGSVRLRPPKLGWVQPDWQLHCSRRNDFGHSLAGTCREHEIPVEITGVEPSVPSPDGQSP